MPRNANNTERSEKLFYIFNSQEERKNCGGSSFVEIQFCKLPFGTKIDDLVSVINISNWENDSLYIRNENEFVREYGNIFDCGTYNNLKTGIVDVYGINYYEPKAIELITKRIIDKKPKGYGMLLEWLEKSKKYNGIYILGI